MKPAKLVLMIMMVLCLSFIVTAQLPPKEQQPQAGQQLDPDRFEAAHGRLLSGQDKAAEASRLTQAVASALPGTGPSYAPVPRKNFVDELIFGRMERDHIPHAPLAGDEEFLRRAYVDATGLLPTLDQARSSTPIFNTAFWLFNVEMRGLERTCTAPCVSRNVINDAKFRV